ncbi:hypothetical protein BOX15_Mlig033758g3, partial [Macrostomum lignano]
AASVKLRSSCSSSSRASRIQKHPEHQSALSLVADEAERLAKDIELLRLRCQRSLHSSSGFSPFLFTNQSSNSEQQQQQLPQPTPPSELDRPSKRRSGAVAAQSRTGGASRSVELPDAVVSGVGVAFVVGAVPGLSLSTPPGAQLHQRHQGSGGSDERQGRIRTQAVQQQQQRLPQFASSTIDSEAAESPPYPPISQSQMIGSPAANQVGAAAQQPEPRKTAAPGPANQQRRSSNIGSTTNQGKMDETAEKFRFTDPAVSASAPSLFLQRLVELSALQAETVRHEKMKANKRKLRS